MPSKSRPTGSPPSETTLGWLSGEASSASSLEGVGATSCSSTRSITTTTLSSAPRPRELLSALAPSRSVGVVTATTREPYVAPSIISRKTSPTCSSLGIDSGAPLS